MGSSHTVGTQTPVCLAVVEVWGRRWNKHRLRGEHVLDAPAAGGQPPVASGCGEEASSSCGALGTHLYLASNLT